MSNSEQKIKFAPIRSVQEFVGGNEWIKPSIKPNELGELQKHVISNLVYYQSNYGAVLIVFLLLVGFCHPGGIIFNLVIVVGLVAAFVLGIREKNAVPVFLNDRPLLILALILIVAYFLVYMLDTVAIFLFGIVLPLALIMVHATIRKQTIQNKETDTVENLSLQTSPMDFFLGWLNTKPIEVPSKPSGKRNK